MNLRINSHKIPIVVFMLAYFSINLYAQKYKSKTSEVHFYSYAPIEDIEADNKGGKSAFDQSSGEIVFSVPIKSFIFEKSLMQEHFNENYMESNKYPTATFEGFISGYDPDIETMQKSDAKGIMKIHGIENRVEYTGEMQFSEKSIRIKTKFQVKLKDYKIKIPKVVFYNIAETIDVTVDFKYELIE